MRELRSVAVTFLLGCMILGSTPRQATGELVGFFDFETSFADQSGNGTSISGRLTALVPGSQGNGILFDGFNDYLDLGVDISPSNMPNLTMGAWVRSLQPNRRRAILSSGDNDSIGFDRQIGIDNRGPGGYEYSAFGGTGTGVIKTGGTINTSEWVFVAARYDGDEVTLFVDEDSVTAIDNTDNDANQRSRLRVGNIAGTNQYFRGAMDNIFVFNESLSDNQIADIRLNGASSIMNISAVPEPSIAVVGVIGISVLTMRRPRRTKRRSP